MIQSYNKILEMESIATLKLEQDRQALEKIKKLLYQEKDFIINKLIIYLERELNIDYFKYKILDIDGNIADILVKKDSLIFKNNIEKKDFLNCNVEELIDNRVFNNKDEIIIIDLNFDEIILNLSYLCDSLNYNYLSYSNNIKEILSTFINYVISKSNN